jgi:DNA invertase Pin-like site-specific DNA recombinase
VCDADVVAKITPAQLREEAAQRLIEPGRRRRELVAQLADVDAEIRPLVMDAIAAEVSHRRIQELTGISRATLTRWTRAATSD